MAKGPAGLAYTLKRSPAYCDRVLWRSNLPHKAAQPRAYWASPDIATSDHKPVAAALDLPLGEGGEGIWGCYRREGWNSRRESSAHCARASSSHACGLRAVGRAVSHAWPGSHNRCLKHPLGLLIPSPPPGPPLSNVPQPPRRLASLTATTTGPGSPSACTSAPCALRARTRGETSLPSSAAGRSRTAARACGCWCQGGA